LPTTYQLNLPSRGGGVYDGAEASSKEEIFAAKASF
jgi:hypothetical protein